MKKILASLLVATMLIAMFVMPSAADDKINLAVEFDYAKKAPTIDGVVNRNEYGALPVHSFPENKEQFDATGNNQYDESEWDFDFYAVWDADNLYMAWVVNTETHAGLPETDHNGDGKYDINDSSYMWQFSCVQFIFTPGVPDTNNVVFQTAQWSGNYLEVGLALSDGGEQIRVAWSKPVNAPALDVNDWDASIKRDDSANTTTYEVRIPWSKSGLLESGNGAKFGLTYAVAAQENYNTKMGMIEWQDAILGGKNADNAAVVELVGNEKIDVTEIPQESTVEKSEGTVPSEAEGKVQLIIDGVDTAISSEKAYLYTDPTTIGGMSTTWSTNVLLAPVDGAEGVYEVKEVVIGAGTTIEFATELTDGMIVYVAHSDGQGDGTARKEAASALVAGTQVKIFGVDFDKKDTLYSNAMVYVVSETEGGDTSTEESTDTSVEESVEASSEAPVESSEAESTATSTATSAATSEAEDEEGGNGWLIWVIIGVVVVAGGAVFAVVLKKKKQ